MRMKLTVLAGAAALLVAIAMPGMASAHGTHLIAKMNGNQVVGDPGAPGGKGTTRLHLLRNKGKVCYKVKYQGIGGRDGLNVGVYRGKKGKNGNEQFVVETEKRSPIKGCVSGIRKKLLKRMLRNPKAYHVTLKTDKYPVDGAIRGQLKSED